MSLRIIMFILVSLILFGCTNPNDRENSTSKKEQEIEQTSEQQEISDNNDDIASHLANIASNVPDVDEAVAIVAGPYAVVGIDVAEKLDRQRVGTIKFSVNEALRDDPYGKTTVVVADADVNERIRNMRERIEDGEPIEGIVDELANIVGRFMPTFPVEEESAEEHQEEEDTITDDGNAKRRTEHPELENEE